jgi:hypothetical protein
VINDPIFRQRAEGTGFQGQGYFYSRWCLKR